MFSQKLLQEMENDGWKFHSLLPLEIHHPSSGSMATGLAAQMAIKFYEEKTSQSPSTQEGTSRVQQKLRGSKEEGGNKKEDPKPSS